MYGDVVLSEYGFYTLKNLPSDEEREAYYREKYYQEAKGGYEIIYSDEELGFINAKLEQKLLLASEYLYPPPHNNTFLDIGCGEGFAVAFFKKKGFSVLGLDYSSAGVKRQNPDVEKDVMLGDIYDSIYSLINNSRQFDIVNMDNVLEHVTDPKSLLQQAHSLLKDGGLVIIKVPNDFSYLQEYFYKHGLIKKAHWIAPLDHISYFNKEGLLGLCKAAGLECIDFFTDQLVEFFALNPNTNYFENKGVGKSCHLARVAQENIFHSISPEKTIALYRVLGDMGLGREIIGVFKKETKQK